MAFPSKRKTASPTQKKILPKLPMYILSGLELLLYVLSLLYLLHSFTMIYQHLSEKLHRRQMHSCTHYRANDTASTNHLTCEVMLCMIQFDFSFLFYFDIMLQLGLKTHSISPTIKETKYCMNKSCMHVLTSKGPPGPISRPATHQVFFTHLHSNPSSTL
jgi:hypothetical protein